MSGLPEADARFIAPAPVAENLMVYLDGDGHVWARNPATGIARHLTGRMPPVEDYLLVSGARPMLGLLTLVDIPPFDPEHATNKQYVDGGYRRLQDQIDLLLAGQVFIGSYDVVQDRAIFINAMGLAPQALPPASDFAAGHYLICITAGMGNGNAPTDLFGVGDQLFSDGTDWVHVKVGGPLITAFQVAVLPPINAREDVQNVLEMLWTGKLDKSGGIMTGALYLPAVAPVAPDQAVAKFYVDVMAGECVQKIGDTMTGQLIMNRASVVFTDSSFGVVFPTGSAIYQATGGTMVLRRDATNAQPCIENNSGAGRWPIIDESTGDARYVNKTGDAMSGTLTIGVSTPIPCLQLVAIGGGAPLIASGGHIFNNTDGTGFATFGSGIFYKRVGTGLVIRLATGNTPLQIENNDGSNLRQIVDMVIGDARYLIKGGDTMTGLLTLNGGILQNAGNIRLKSTSNGVDGGQVIQWQDASGRPTGQINCFQTGSVVAGQAEGRIEIWSMNGGWGWQRIMTSTTNSPTQTQWNGALNAPAYNISSDRRLKSEIVPADPEEAQTIFDAVTPVRFKRVDNQDDPDRMYWGLLADDFLPTGPDLVRKVPVDSIEDLLHYDLGGAVAVMVTLLKSQQAQMAKQAETIDTLQEQLATLEERFSNKMIADLEGQVALMREQLTKPNLRKPKPPELPEK